MDDSEYMQWQKEKNITTLKSKIEKAYKEFEKAADIKEFYKIAEKYNSLFYIENDELFERNENIFAKNANEDGIFQVDNNIYKLLGNDLVYTNIENISDLKSATKSEYIDNETFNVIHI
jgi:asparagine synthetase A